MKLEDAIPFIRQGHRIYRTSCPDRGYLQGTLESVCGSFYMTIYDILADDWVVKKLRQRKGKNVGG